MPSTSVTSFVALLWTHSRTWDHRHGGIQSLSEGQERTGVFLCDGTGEVPYLRVGEEPTESLKIRIKEQTTMGDIAVGVCC